MGIHTISNGRQPSSPGHFHASHTPCRPEYDVCKTACRDPNNPRRSKTDFLAESLFCYTTTTQGTYIKDSNLNPYQLVISTKYDEGICDEVITVYVALMCGFESHIPPSLLLPLRTMAKTRLYFHCPLPTR